MALNFWAIRRIDRNYVEPTLYKSEAAAVGAAARRRGYDVLPLFSEAKSTGSPLGGEGNPATDEQIDPALQTQGADTQP